jgi:MFS family permease
MSLELFDVAPNRNQTRSGGGDGNHYIAHRRITSRSNSGTSVASSSDLSDNGTTSRRRRRRLRDSFSRTEPSTSSLLCDSTTAFAMTVTSPYSDEPSSHNDSLESRQPLAPNLTPDGGYHCAPQVPVTTTDSSRGSPRTLDEFLDACWHEANNGTVAATAMNHHGPSLTDTTMASLSASTPPLQSKRLYPWRYWFMFVSLGLANSSDAAEILCLSYILSLDDFQAHMLHHSAANAGLLAATVFLGMLLGGLVVGSVGDVWGRRPTLLCGLLLNAGAGLASAAAWNVYLLATCRLVAGLGVGATVPPLFSLASELSPPATRGVGVTMVASFWMVGSMYVAIVGWILLGRPDETDSSAAAASNSIALWRVFAVACALPSCLASLVVRASVPESPRFLLLQGQYDHALVVVQRIADSLHYTGPALTRNELVFHFPPPSHARGGSTTDIVGEEDAMDEDEWMSPATDSDDGFVGRRRSPSDKILTTATSSRYDTYSPVLGHPGRRRSSASLGSKQESKLALLCRMVGTSLHEFIDSSRQLYTKQLRSTTLPLQMVWFSLSFGSYGLLTWINTLFEQVHLENVYFNALLFAASNLPGNLIAAYFMDKTGRASLLTGSVLAAAASLMAFAYVAAAQDRATNVPTVSTAWIVVAACSFQCFTTAAWNAIDVLSSELFPTVVRSTGMGMCAATGRVGAMLAQFVNGALVSHPVRLLLVAAATLLFGSLTPLWLPSDQTGQPVSDYTVATTSTSTTTGTGNTSSVVSAPVSPRHSPVTRPTTTLV